MQTASRVMEIDTPLGDGVLLFHGMQAREEMGRLSELNLDLLSARHDINIDDILGKNVTVRLALPDEKTRFFNGYVTRFAQSGSYGRYNRYVAVVRPWFWLQGTHGIEVPSGCLVRVTAPHAGQVILTLGGSRVLGSVMCASLFLPVAVVVTGMRKAVVGAQP